MVNPAGEPPSARRGHSLTLLSYHLWCFGGLSGFSRYQNDVSCYDTLTNTWIVPTVLSSPAGIVHSRKIERVF
jgi:hypothetical protein